MVRESMEPALQRILTPKSSTDVLRSVSLPPTPRQPARTRVLTGSR